MTCSQFVALFLEHARCYYVRPDGSPTGHAVNLEICLRWWVKDLPVEDVGLGQLQAYRAMLLERGLKARTVNQYVGWVRSAFRWGAETGHVPVRVAAELAVLRPLRAKEQRDSHRQRTVDMGTLRAIASYLDRRGRAGDMLRVEWLTGARPGEIRRMEWEELQAVGDHWVYRPTRHKVEHYGISRVLVLVPEAVGYLGPQQTGAVFKTRIGTGYSASGYAQAIARACTALGVERITPLGVRRAAATAARALAGAEAAQRLLGHTSTAMTEEYFDLGWIDTVEEVKRMRERGWGFDGGGGGRSRDALDSL
ncbi:MAG: tyrosine-type recombinase/integrase [Planctomycetota bacterium]